MDGQGGRTRGTAHDALLRAAIWGGAALLWLAPWVAMRFSSEVEWDALDFALAAAMLASACGLCELGMRLSSRPAYRLAFAIAVATGLLTVWVNLAVGMIGSEAAPVNLVFAGVLVVAIAGSIRARGHARGMGRAMAAAGLAQVLATALASWWAGSNADFVPALVFASGWWMSALLFRASTGTRG